MAAASQGLLDFKYPSLVGLDTYITPKKFDIQKFNQEFEKKKELTKMYIGEIEQQRLQQLNQMEKPKKPYELTVAEIIINTKDTWFSLVSDLFQQKFYSETFTKDNRLFYIGLTIILTIIFVYLYNTILR